MAKKDKTNRRRAAATSRLEKKARIRGEFDERAKANSESEQVGVSRRRILMGLLAGGALVAADPFDIFGGNPPPLPISPPPARPVSPVPKTKKGPQTLDILKILDEHADKMLEGLEPYESWAARVALPTVEYDESSPDWSREQIAAHFIPESMDHSALTAFYAAFDQHKQHYEDKLKVAGSPDDQEKIVEAFVLGVLKAYKKASHDPTSETELLNSREVYHKMGTLLVLHGYWLDAQRNPKGKRLYALHEVDRAQSFTVRLDGQHHDLPLVSLGKGGDMMDYGSEKTGQIQGRYVDEGDFILLNRSGIEKAALMQVPVIKQRKKGAHVDPKMVVEMAIQNSLNHEGAHAALMRLKGIHYRGRGAIQKTGPIHMGHYPILKSDLRYPDNVQVHELIGLGMGLRHSGSLGYLEAANTVVNPVSTYSFAHFVLITELLHNPKMDTRKRMGLILGQREKGMPRTSALSDVVMNIPDQEIHQMGERMAKLGLYLLQSD